MAATAKQLAALKKGREAMAKKRAAGTVKKRVAKKPAAKRKAKVVKKNPVKKTLPDKFIVKITAKGKVGYLVGLNDFDTDIQLAKKFTKTLANKNANRVFAVLSRQRADFKTIEVCPAPKR